jgi:hypothetical protein
VKAGLIRWSSDYCFDDYKNDLIKHGAVVVVKAATFRRYPDFFESGHPSGAEPGDWYSLEPIGLDGIQEIMIGQDMLDWLEPSEPDFTYRLCNVLRMRST